MDSKWLYSRDGTDHGPVSSGELLELARNGKLLRTDLLWKEGMVEWKYAGEFANLFPQEADKELPAVIVTATKKAKKQVSAGKSKTAQALARRATSTLQAHAQAAGRLGKIVAEKTRITTVSLPLAYAELGKHRYATRENEKEFEAIFGELDGVTALIAANAKATQARKAASLAEKAQEMASQGIQLANAQKLILQQKSLLCTLGKQVYAQEGIQAGPEPLVETIRTLVGRLASLEKELSDNVRKAGGRQRLLVIAGGLLVAVLVSWAVFYSPSGTAVGRWGAKPMFFESGGDGTVAVVGKSFSKKQMAALFVKAQRLARGMSERQVFAALGTPTEENRMKQGPGGLSELNLYAWTMKSKERQTFILVVVEKRCVLGITVANDGVVQ